MSVIKQQLSSAEATLLMTQNSNDAQFIDLIKHSNLSLLKINEAGETLLHNAAKDGNISITQYLINAGSEVNAQDILGKTPLMHAIENKSPGCLKVIKILCKANADIYITDKYGKNALNSVINDSYYRYDCIQKFFLEIIHRECMNNSTMTAKRLIQLRYPLWQAVLLRSAEVIEDMIIQGSPVNSCHPGEQLTALSKAVEIMDLDIIKTLIKYGADVDLCDRHNFHPISRYSSRISGGIQQPDIIKILLQKSVLLKNIHKKFITYQFKTAFEFGNKEVIQILLEHHSDILKMTDVEDQTPLHYLSGNLHSDITEPLIGRTIDVNVRDLEGCTPLYMATKYSHSHVNTFKFLLENGANVNVTTIFEFDFDTPLFSLCQNRFIKKNVYFKIIEMFLQYGLDVQFVGKNKKTVFDVIIENQTFYMSKPLIAHLVLLEEFKKPIIECIRHKIMSHHIFRECFKVCKAKLAQMRNNVIHEKLTLYMIIINEVSEKQVLKSCRFSVSALPRLHKLKNEFHLDSHYYATVIKQISSIVSKLELWKKTAPIICKLLKFGNNPNHIVVCEILDYLSNQDLQTLMKVGL